MHFDIALLTSHGTSRGYYMDDLRTNLGINYSQAGVNNNGSVQYKKLFYAKLKQYTFESINLLNIDNSLSSKIAPLEFYNSFFNERTLFINVVRDPIKKFCTIYNFYNFFAVKNKNYAAFSCDRACNSKNIFCERYWDNMMAIPFARFNDLSENFIFLDSEDLRAQNARETFALIQKRSTSVQHSLRQSVNTGCALTEIRKKF